MDPLELARLPDLMVMTRGRADLVVGLVDGSVAGDHLDLVAGNVRTIPETAGACRDTGSATWRHGALVAGILAARRGARAPAIAPNCTLLVRPTFSDTGPAAELPSATPGALAEAILDCVDAGARIVNVSAVLTGGSLGPALPYPARRDAQHTLEEVHMTSKLFSRGCLILVLMLVAAGCGPSAPAPPAPECNDQQVHEEVLQGAIRDTAEEIVVNCNLTVPLNFIITKRLIVEGREGSRVTIDCQGESIDGSRVSDDELSRENAQEKDMIVIRSTSDSREIWSPWSRPTDVTVKNCDIVGSVRIHVDTGLAQLRRSSYKSGHATQMQRIAPTRVTLDNLTITGRGREPVYIGNGVTNSRLINSELKGKSDAVALYLDAESSQNVIKNNYIHTVTSREVLAVDGSNYNQIISNRFSALSKGGIYLYRNCGEDGIVRHTTPSNNTIVNNVFYYDNYSPSPFSVNPSVYMGSRNGSRPGDCEEDKGHPIGSGASNLDYAQHNAVMQNQIYKLDTDLMIQQGRSTDSPNYIKLNTTVQTPISRPAGCYIPNNNIDFITHDESIELSGRRYTCNDGELTA